MNKVGILTFHCADNCGAMLQAYGLKYYLMEKKMDVEIVNYEPPFMAGRHWWIPYIPSESIVRSLIWGFSGWRTHLKRGTSFFEQRCNMKRFRKKYLIKKEQKKVIFAFQLKYLPYQSYIVGSDQIWNPDITCGLRRAYFGAFKNRNKKKVIAYAASIGSASLPEEYNKEFSELIKYVDSISVREESSIPYIKRFYAKDVLAVPDPVFLLKKKSWEKIEKLPDEGGYIVVCITEKNNKLLNYVKELSESYGLPVIKIENGIEMEDEDFKVDRTVGPSEYLGYIHKANFVVTNSFHMIAFSIIYQKKFVAFQHSHAGERITNLLKWCELENRLYQDGKKVKIDDTIDWSKVGERVEMSVKTAKQFLRENVEQKWVS